MSKLYHRIFSEDWTTSFATPTDQATVEVFKNPGPRELRDIHSASNQSGTRWLLDSKGNAYAFREDCLHDWARKAIGLNGSISVEVDPREKTVFYFEVNPEEGEMVRKNPVLRKLFKGFELRTTYNDERGFMN